MNLKIKLVFMVMLFVSAVNYAQESITVIGSVTSETDGEPILGANIIVIGSTTGTSTDFDGNYQIKTESGAVLQFSYIGFVSKSVTVTDQKTINVVLAEDANALDEIVVVGYGSRKKSDITGAVSSVTADELNAFPVLDAAQALQGRAAGVVVQSNNGGEPGAPINIEIRGNTSIGSNSAALIVVDGFVGATFPQANDIQSIEVLKDASATAIYGSRGSNGVVLVTTKKGKNGKLSVELNTSYAIQNTANRLDLLNADQFATYRNQIRDNAGTTDRYPQGSANTDWQDLIFTQGSTTSHQVSFSGGTDKTSFYASANYFNQEGIVINSDFERLTFLSNIDAQVTDKLKLGMNLFGSRGVQNGVLTQSTGATANGGGDDVIGLVLRFSPDSGILNDDGTFTQSNVGDGIENPFAVANELINETKSDNFRANLYLNYDIFENLSFKTTLGYSMRNENVGTFKPQTFVLSNGFASLSNRRGTNLLSENYLTYKQKIGKGDLTILAGYSYQKEETVRFSALTRELIADRFLFYNLEVGHLDTRRVTSNITERTIQSQFARINYDYDDRYLFTATIRRDGSSNFAANNKYGIFPSGAFGWKVSNEKFLKDSETISNLKLRASYGVTGNQAISPYQSLERIGFQGATAIATDPSFSLLQEANPNLKWESSFQTNIGVDVGFLNNRYNISLDYYNIDTKNLLLETTRTPLFLGATSARTFGNVGEINTNGFEVSINARIISTDDFSWTSDFNISTNKNKVVKLFNGAEIIDSAAPGYFVSPNTYILREGEAIGLFWGREYQGVYQGGNVPEGTALVGAFQAGDPLFTDVNNDGMINEKDDKIIGDPNADFTWGLTNNFSYKNWDLNVFLQGSQGGEILNLTNVQLFNGDSNSVVSVLDAWTPSNTGSNLPRNVASRGSEISTRFVEDGSYIRLKNIAIGYNFPSVTLEKLGIDNLRLAVSAQNLLTFTNYSGLDPEVSYFGNGGGDAVTKNVAQGHDYGNYPTVRSVNFSLNLKF